MNGLFWSRVFKYRQIDHVKGKILLCKQLKVEIMVQHPQKRTKNEWAALGEKDLSFMACPYLHIFV